MGNKITHFNKMIISVLRNEIQAALTGIKEKYGLAELELQQISFDQHSFSGKLFASVPAYKKMEEEYSIELIKQFAIQNGLPADLLNRTFVSNGKTHTVTGIEIRNPKYPIITKCSDDGKNYKFTVQIVQEIFARYDNTSQQSDAILKLVHNSGN